MSERCLGINCFCLGHMTARRCRDIAPIGVQQLTNTLTRPAGATKLLTTTKIMHTTANHPGISLLAIHKAKLIKNYGIFHSLEFTYAWP